MSSPNPGTMGSGAFSFDVGATTTVTVDTSQLKQAKADADQLDQKVELAGLKLMTWWNYGMQITNMLFRDLSKLAKGTQAQAGMQLTLSVLQKIQAEASVVFAETRALEAFASGNIAQGVMLQVIAGMLQWNVVQSIAMEVQQNLAKQQAEELRAQIEAYRS